jgi:MYXO-CTERM domain-containing protein
MRASAGQWDESFCAAAAPVPHVDAGSEPLDAGPPDAAPHVDAAPDATGGTGGHDASVPPPPGKSGCSSAAGTPVSAGGLAIAALVLGMGVLAGRRRRN